MALLNTLLKTQRISVAEIVETKRSTRAQFTAMPCAWLIMPRNGRSRQVMSASSMRWYYFPRNAGAFSYAVYQNHPILNVRFENRVTLIGVRGKYEFRFSDYPV